MDVAEAFLRTWTGVATIDRSSLCAALDAAWRQAGLRFPGLQLELETFAAYLGTKVPADVSSVVGSVQALHTAELYLARACAAQDPSAIRTFEVEVLPAVTAALRKMRLDDAERQEVRQQVRVKLLTGDDPRILRYEGRGDLKAWVKVVAVRAALNTKRGDWRHASVEDAILAELPEPGGNPEATAFLRDYRVQFVSCAAAAFAELTRTQRTLMRQHHLDELTIGALARAHGVHRVTASRWLKEARDALVVGLRRRLAEALALPRDELDGVLDHLGTQVDFSVRRLLATPSGAQQSGDQH